MRLPVDAAIPELLAAFARSRSVVLEAPPGAGKTTRVPPALSALGSGEVLVLEPRRLAARLAARRVAEELDERVGETVGYQVRFEDVSGPRTRIRFLTEGVLTRRLLADSSLDGVDTVILDEFHERHLDGDLALALLLRLQRTRRADLRLLVMSATLDALPLAAHLGDCPVVRSEGRLFDTDLRWTPSSSLSVEEQTAAALDRLSREPLPGDVLVFLPGAREIRRAMELSESVLRKHDWLGVALYGDLSPEEQDRAVRRADRRKVIFSTNIAESSVTIEGVRVVVDSGLARVPQDSPWTGLPSLEIKRISQASARQRAGRAARTGPGIVVRLYTEDDFVRRPAQDIPEIRRRELSHLLLDVRAMGMDIAALPWLDGPPPAAVEAASALLDRLGATGEAAAQMARLPLHPRLSRLVIEAASLGALREGAMAAARISAGGSEAEVRRIASQVERAVRLRPKIHDDHAVEKATLAAFPDRVAKRHREDEVLLAGGGSAVLAGRPRNVPEWLVAVDVEHRRERGHPVVREWTAIESDWLIEYFADRIEDRCDLVWNRDAERVDEVRAMRYDGLVIEETRARPRDLPAASNLLADKAMGVLHRFADPDAVQALTARAKFSGGSGTVDIRSCVEELSTGCISFAELAAAAGDGGLVRMLESRLGSLAPEWLTLPSGRRTRIHYEEGKPPWVASRLQDFFGLKESPRVNGVTVVCHLLAPSQRPVQITSDLAGFWTRHYPEIRRELSRRYPKHSWPEKPL